MELSNEFDVRVPIDQAWGVLTDIELIAPCLPGAQLQEVDGDQYRGIVKIKVGPITAQYQGTARLIETDEGTYRAVLSASGRDTRGQGHANATITAELVPKGDITHVSLLTDLTITGKVAQFGRGVIGEVSVKLLDQFVVNLESTVLSSDGTDAEATPPGNPPAESATPDDSASTGITADAKDPEETAEMIATGLAQVWQENVEGESDPVRAERPALRPRPDLLVAEQGLTPNESAATVSSNGSGARRIDSPVAEPIDLLETAGGSVVTRVVPVVAVAFVVLVIVGLRRRARRRR